ncbi:D-alanyl-D-alanine carboxypeptidase/D-alanyl-D-alanine-endopeptidase [Myxococcota bacterium]|nr:D-alanyl-D-alanine carboxypeptidase/D-alanyl-D-alanine-endopeptidase [Myxococcota bacterium]
MRGWVRALWTPVLGLVMGYPGWAGESPANLNERLDAALAAPALRGARVSALVVEEGSGRVLYGSRPDRELVPASNQKVLTAFAALEAFGPTHRFVTEIHADRRPDSEGEVEWLVLRGGGDPALTSERFWRMVSDLRMQGLRRVKNGIRVDAGAFAGGRWHPSWGKTSARAYHAPVSALTVNYGAFSVSVRPGPSSGSRALAVLDPAVPWLKLVDRANTGSSGSRARLRVDRAAAEGFERVTVSGTLPVGGEPRRVHRSVLDPARYAGAVLRSQLEAQGIRVEGAVQSAPTPTGSVLLLAFEGPPMAEIVGLMMKYSNNGIAESLVKNLGARASEGVGSWENGIPALRAELTGAGIDLAGATLVDGSGLSYDNKISPRALVDILLAARRSFRSGPEFIASLPISSLDGTLEERVDEAPGEIRAKTGLLTRVTALSGFARPPGGSTAVFSILVNGFRSSPDRAMRAVDAFVEALVEGRFSVEETPPNS